MECSRWSGDSKHWGRRDYGTTFPAAGEVLSCRKTFDGGSSSFHPVWSSVSQSLLQGSSKVDWFDRFIMMRYHCGIELCFFWYC